ncbi:hypothetical protein [Marinomonas sp.]
MFIIRAFLYLIFVAVVAQMVTFEGFQQLTLAQYSERSMVEYLQSALLLVACAMFYLSARLHEGLKIAALLTTSLLAMMFVRESDAVLDTYVFDGAWQMLVSLIIVLTLFSLRGQFRAIYASLKEYSQHSSFGIFLAGLVTVLAFSRLMGQGAFWHALMGEGYMRVVKNVVEEGIETLGYTLIVIAASELLVFCWSYQKKHQLQVSKSHRILNEASA